MDFRIPKEIQGCALKLQGAGFQAYLVGGCVRDLLLDREPKDWDIATDAKPEEIQKIFPESVYENQFGTVAVKTQSSKRELQIVEITTFRKEGKYTDKRHPDEIKFAKTIEEDLSRRDFTVNAMAMQLGIRNKELGIRKKAKVTKPYSFIIPNSLFEIIDPYGGQKDLKNKLIRTVGDPKERFNEDALRLMRAVRFAVELGFSAKGGPASGCEIEEKTAAAIKQEAGLLEMIAKERIRDEFIKIVMADGSPSTGSGSKEGNPSTSSGTLSFTGAARGIQLLEDLGLLKHVIPELREGIRVGQNKHHIYTVWEHNLRALDYAASKNYSFEVRLASLLHDVGKPRTKQGEGLDSTFHGHEIVGAKMTAQIMDRLRFPKEIAEKVIHLVRFHLFYYNVGEVSAAGVRRFLARVGKENVPDLIKVREADRIGSGVPKAVPYKLRHLLFMIEKVKSDPISPKMLGVTGNDVMETLKIPPGPKVGQILTILLEEVLDDPKKNKKEDLRLRIKELGQISDLELAGFAKKAREKKEEFEGGIEEEMKRKFYVK